MDFLKTSFLALWLIVNPANGEEPAKVAPAPVYQTIDESIAKGDLADVRLHIAANPQSLKQGGRENSRPPLEQAVIRNKTDIVLYLLEAGADPNTVNASQRTPLHLAVDRNNPVVAAAKNQLETAKAILAGGADPMTLSNLGGTPLHEAAASGGAEMIRLLLDHKVDPQVVSKQGVTALDLAKQYKNQPAIDALSK